MVVPHMLLSSIDMSHFGTSSGVGMFVFAH